MAIWYKATGFQSVGGFRPEIKEVEVVKSTKTRVYFKNGRFENKSTYGGFWDHMYFEALAEALDFCITAGEKALGNYQKKVSESEINLERIKEQRKQLAPKPVCLSLKGK